MIRFVQIGDAAQICEIYNPWVLNTTITFEEVAVGVEEMQERILAATVEFPWFVWESGGRLLGYCYAGRWKGRPAYRYSAETTIYVRKENTGQGIGSSLYRVLLDALREQGVHTAIGGIALPNEQSIRIHEKAGFVKVAHFKEVGQKFGAWIDVGYWQLVFENQTK